MPLSQILMQFSCAFANTEYFTYSSYCLPCCLEVVSGFGWVSILLHNLHAVHKHCPKLTRGADKWNKVGFHQLWNCWTS